MFEKYLWEIFYIWEVAMGGNLCYDTCDVLVAQLDRALDSDSKGQRFKSSRAHHVAVDSAMPIPQENLRDFPCSVTAPIPQKVTFASAKPLQARALYADLLTTNFLWICRLRRRFIALHLFPQHIPNRSKVRFVPIFFFKRSRPPASLLFLFRKKACACELRLRAVVRTAHRFCQ